jgi:hypothetical protein
MRIVGAIFVLIVLLLILEMLRQQKLREKYAILWLTVGLATLILAAFPRLLFWAANLVGVQVPSNLLFASTFVLLIGVCVHLSWELSHAEDRTRRLAEEVAILREQVAEISTSITSEGKNTNTENSPTGESDHGHE